MPRIQMVPAHQAPRPPARMDEVTAAIAAALARLDAGAVLRLEPDGDECLDGLKTVVEHVAVTHGMCVASWTDGREACLYVHRSG